SKKAALILGVPRLAGHTLAEILNFSPMEEQLFRDWVEIVRNEYPLQRWQKLERLAPVREIQIGEGANKRHIVLEYQKILNQEGGLSKIMVLARDVTETRKIERRLQDEKIHHEKTVKTILGISKHLPETILDFLKDTTGRIRSMDEKLREIGSATDQIRLSWATQIFKDCHTIKGNAGAFGFEGLAVAAEDFENLLQSSLSEKGGLGNHIQSATQKSETMLRETDNINEVFLILAGDSEEVSVRLEEAKVIRIRQNAESISDASLSQELAVLVESCRRISYRSLFSLTRKYRGLVQRAALKTGKTIEFSITPPNLELDANILTKADEALVHLLRNAVAHGIESDAIRAALGKGKGRIELNYSIAKDGTHSLSIKDNGQGISVDTVVAKAMKAGIVSQGSLSRMSVQEKMELVFSPGVSSSTEVDTLSGRGLGLAIVSDCIRAAGGQITLEGSPGEGTRFTIIMPI
ncbi:MAG: ATP-binding protein, partial [Fibrobacterota bacterium]|nr:ATP-binding protein [Fibrobacterota bacterium]